MIIKTKGRARQKTMTLARKAGVEIKAVVFTRKELLEALGFDPGKRYGTKRDNCLGRCWQNHGVIWLRLPVSLSTIAHEVTHLFTTISHNTRSFENKKIALQRGYAPAQHKAKWYEVTVTTIAKYRVYELTAWQAKKHACYPPISSNQTMTARAVTGGK